MWLTSPKKYRSGQLEIAACSAEFGRCSLGRPGLQPGRAASLALPGWNNLDLSSVERRCREKSQFRREQH